MHLTELCEEDIHERNAICKNIRHFYLLIKFLFLQLFRFNGLTLAEMYIFFYPDSPPLHGMILEQNECLIKVMELKKLA